MNLCIISKDGRRKTHFVRDDNMIHTTYEVDFSGASVRALEHCKVFLNVFGSLESMDIPILKIVEFLREAGIPVRQKRFITS